MNIIMNLVDKMVSKYIDFRTHNSNIKPPVDIPVLIVTSNRDYVVGYIFDDVWYATDGENKRVIDTPLYWKHITDSNWTYIFSPHRAVISDEDFDKLLAEKDTVGEEVCKFYKERMKQLGMI
jgi:hypothetical protein